MEGHWKKHIQNALRALFLHAKALRLRSQVTLQVDRRPFIFAVMFVPMLVRRFFLFARRIASPARPFHGPVLVALLFVFGAIFYIAQFVLAEKEEHIYVFPSYITNEGWERVDLALTQDLSSSAVYADFSVHNAAYLMLGGVPLAPQGDAATSSENEMPIDSVGDEVAPIPIGQEDSMGQSPDLGSEKGGGRDISPASDGVRDVIDTLPVGEEQGETLNTSSSVPIPTTAPTAPTGFENTSAYNRWMMFFARLTNPGSVNAQSADAPAAAEDNDSREMGAPTTSSSAVKEETSSAPSQEPVEKPPKEAASDTERLEEVSTPVRNNTPSVTDTIERLPDAYETALCTTLGKTCRFMEFAGFGLGGILGEREFLGGALELSIAGRGSFTAIEHDRLLVRARIAGKWTYLGEIVLEGEFSNGTRGGYASFEIPELVDWSDLADLRVVLEFDRANDEYTAIFVDGIWINARYKSLLGESTTDREDLALSGANIRSTLAAMDREARRTMRDRLLLPEGRMIEFSHGEEYPNARLLVRTDQSRYYALGTFETYFNVTNDGDTPQEFRLQFHLPVEYAKPEGAERPPEGTGRIMRLEQFSRRVPHKIGTPKYDAVGYFCAGGWSVSGVREDVSENKVTGGSYVCAESLEIRTCSTLNEDGTNCIDEGVTVGVVEDTVYRPGWNPIPVVEGSFADTDGIFARAFNALFAEIPEGTISPSLAAAAHTAENIVLEPGATAYLRAVIEVPLNTRGDIAIEAAAKDGAYGLVTSEWNGSWNHRIPVNIAIANDEPATEFAMPISFDDLPDAFWERVDHLGGDIRFVDERFGRELPYWLSSWNYEERRGEAWVRVPAGGAERTVSLYYGDPDAVSASDPVAPFRTETPLPRALVVGRSDGHISASILARDDFTRVIVGGVERGTLRSGEEMVIVDAKSGDVILADGPIVVSAIAPMGGAAIIPFAFSGSEFIAASMGDATEFVLAASAKNIPGLIHYPDAEAIRFDAVSGSLARAPFEGEESTRLSFDGNTLLLLDRSVDPVHATDLLTPLYPATEDSLYGFAAGEFPIVGVGEDASRWTALCSSGARKSVDGRRAGSRVKIDHCYTGGLYAADAVAIVDVNQPLSAFLVQPQRNVGISPFLPRKEFGSRYVTRDEAEGIGILCASEDGPIDIGFYAFDGTLIASSTCEGRGVYPGKVFLAPPSGRFPAGMTIVAANEKPFIAAIQLPEKNGEIGGMHMLESFPLGRAATPVLQGITIGTPEFVIPGEHRKFDRTSDGKERPHVNDLLSRKREFSMREGPTFHFRYKPQSSGFVQGIRSIFGVEQFSVVRVMLRHGNDAPIEIPHDIVYGEDGEWRLALADPNKRMKPGKYTLALTIEEGGEEYTDEFDFYWGVLALNFQQSIYVPRERVDIAMAVLSPNGNTVCDAHLKLFVAAPGRRDEEVPVTPSGVCSGNNVVDIPDYTATYQIPDAATGTYRVRLVRLDESENVLVETSDTFEVRETVPYVIERFGPTRIYPLAQYKMKIRIRAHEAFRGAFVETVPGDFVFIDRGNANLEWGDKEHTFITATWETDLEPNEVLDLEYTFDAPDRSPYLYLLGPAVMRGEHSEFREARTWQIASDAAGRMMVFYDGSGAIPSGWTCVSCLSTDTFWQRLVVGSSSYNGAALGTATHTPTALATVNVTGATGVGPNTTNNTRNAPLSHTHDLTPQISAASNYPAFADLRIIQSNSAGDPGTLPAGTIGIFDIASSSLPAGWYRYDRIDGRYIRGHDSVTGTGGAHTHFHTATGTLAAPTQSGVREQFGVPNGSSDISHTHTLSATNTDVINHEPPYVEVIFARLSVASGTPNYLITMWDNTEPNGWVTMSNPGEPFDGKFLKASTTYGATGGSSSHQHANIIGATTSAPSILGGYNVNASNAQAPASHTHDVDITDFSTDSHLPPHIEVIFAKRLSGIPFYTQSAYRFYANTNGLTPTDPWPAGGADYDENTPVTSSGDSIAVNTRLRIRMNLKVTNATTTTLAQAFKLQYVAADDCANALNWSDVPGIGASGVPWRGYNNTTPADGASIPSYLLSSSTVTQTYEEENNSAANPNQIDVGAYAEWDWVIEQLQATASTLYCFRMVRSDGTPLDVYENYPQILTNAAPNTVVPATPFSFEKVGTTTPALTFAAADSEANDLDYQIQISVATSFLSPVVDNDTLLNPELFDNLTTPANKAPFFSGDTIQFKPSPGTLSNGTTYWWRVRAKDVAGSNTWGEWSDIRSFTVDTAVITSTWFQTTSDQFNENTLVGVNSSSTDQVMLNTGSTTGVMYSDPIDFSVATAGTAWASLAWNDIETSSDVTYQVEYFTSTSSWELIPDTALSGNSAGFDTSPVSLLNLNPNDYAKIRVRANMSDLGQTPAVSDWTVSWGYKVNTPVLYAPFDNQKVATHTPAFEFAATDPRGEDLLYEIQWSTTADFSASTTRNSGAHAGFTNLTTSTDTNPFYSGNRIRFTIQPADALASSTTYFWRVRAIDPGGDNVWSFWSETRSITIDTTVQVSTWFQTHNDQFLTDTLSSMRTYSNGSTTVATTTDEAMIAYGEGTVTTPRYRIFNGISLGSEQSALSVGAAIHWLTVKASPLGNQYIMGTLGGDRDTNFQVYQNGAWGDLYEGGTNAPSLQRRSFDVAFETNSGRALAVTCDSSPDPEYRIWDGTAWSATGTINLGFTSNCEWVRLASHPTSNEIIGLFRNTGNQYEAQVWNATTSTWGNSITQGSMTEIAHEGMAVEYNASGSLAMVVTSNGTNANFVWRTWDGTAWSAASTQAIGDDFEWGNLRRNTNNNDLILCYVDHDNDIGVKRWTGGAWSATVELDTLGATKDGRPTDCLYETTPGRTNYITTTYGTTSGTGYRYWNTTSWIAEVPIGSPAWGATFTHRLERTNASGTILGLFFDHLNTDYLFGLHYGTQAWPPATLQTVETSASVTVSPYGEPFSMAAKFPATQGTILSTPIDFDDGVAPAWSQVSWDATTPGASSFVMQIEFQNASGTWELVPDSDLPGNSTGTSSSPLNITNLHSTTYNVIRLKGTATCVSGICPVLNDWTVKWAAGIRISGVARAHDLATPVTSGTVAVAVNGSLQSGKTGLIDSSGNWFIDNVTVFTGQTLTVFIDGAASVSRAASVAKYGGTGDLGGLYLAERWLTIGSASTTGTTVTLSDIALYDNSSSGGDADLFFDVDGGGDYNNCVSGTCLDSGLYVFANTFRPSSATAETINTWDMRIGSGATLTADANTIKVGGDWRNAGSFNANTGTVIMNATSSTRTIDSTGATTASFNNITFGESGSTATWNMNSPLTALGTLAINYGTVSPGAFALTLQGDLSIGASGIFSKGSATTTFSGTVQRTWTDNTATKQDLGNVLIDGGVKTVTLGSSVRATSVRIGADDTLDAGSGSNNFTVLGFWENAGTFVAQTGTVTFATTTASVTISHGGSDFYNLAFAGAGGSFRFLNTNATATNNVSITAGTVTMPGGTLAIGGSFDNSGGTWLHNDGELRFTSTTGGKNVRFGGSDARTVVFVGSGGGWTFLDTNATTTGSFTVFSGTPVLPSGTLAVGDHFDISGGSITANGGTVRMTSSLTARTIRLSGSSLASLFIAGSGEFTFADLHATATGDITFAAGTTTLPGGSMAIGGSLTNSAVFDAGTSQVRLNPTSGTKTVNPGNSSFYALNIMPATGATVEMTANATATNNVMIVSGNFVADSGTIFAVGGTFTNTVGGVSTTWTGATLYLYAGTSFTTNTKTTGADAYGTLNLGANTHIRMWNSSATSYALHPTSSVYSQDHGGTDGALNIYGAYSRTSGADYWSAATDFDGTALATSSQRAVAVRFSSGASATFADSATLEIIGTSTATTTVDRIASGSYTLVVSSSTVNARYYRFNWLDAGGLQLLASTTIVSLMDGDFELDTNGGTALTISSTTIAKNAGLQVFRVRFALGAASSGVNVTELGTTGSTAAFIRFREHYGGLDGEAFDADGGNPGDVRWDDSQFVVTISGTVYSDAGATPMGAPTCDDVTPVVRVMVDGGGNFIAPCSSANGSFTVSGVTFQGDTVMTTYLDNVSGRRAVTVTRSAAGDVSDMHLYQDRVIVRHEDVTAMTIAKMGVFHKPYDADIPFTVSTSGTHTLTVDPEIEFWIWTGKTFVPGGNITLNSGGSGNNWDGTFHVDNNATFTASGNEAHSVGGRFVVDAGGTFTAASSTFTFTATTSGKVITATAPLTFWGVVTNGTGGNWSVNTNITIGDTLTLLAGTLSGTSNITVNGVNVTGGAGTIAMTGGTFTLASGGLFGGSADWSFNDLVFSGTSATTTKTGSSSVTVAGTLTVSANHALLAGTSTTWILSGAPTPFVRTGIFDPQSAVVRYAATANATAASGDYYILEFSSTGMATPTYTLAAGTFSIADRLTIGNASNTLAVNANTNDPALIVGGDFFITSAATFVGSNIASTTMRGSWTNEGTFTHSSGTVTFDAASGGHTVSAGASSFGNVRFDNASGGWTIVAHATATGMFTIANAATFTVSPGVVLEAKGTFRNEVGGSATTWTGSTLFLNSATAYEMNASTTADTYATLDIGANTDVRMWNSSAATTTVSTSGSLYSQDHAGTDGLLMIWGDYGRSSGIDYWSYATDFDGTPLSGSALREVHVRFATSAAVTISGSGALEIVGAPGASTTLDQMSVNTWAFGISGGSTTMRYVSVRHTDGNGINITGSPVIESLSDVDFELSTDGGSMITVSGSAIDANPLKTFFRNRFATSSGVSSGFNVKATGASASAWRFNLHYGGRDGEAYDSDPGGDPGYIIWDDSAANIIISGNVYSDEGLTPIGAPTCDGVTQNVRLRVQGGGNYTSACNTSTGAFSIANVIYNPGDTLTLYLDTGGGARAVNVAFDPVTNIPDMDLYQDRVIVRHEQSSAVGITHMNAYDNDDDTDIPFTARTGPNTLAIPANTALIVWDGKTFAPGGDVTVHANATANNRDGTVKLFPSAVWRSSGTEVHTIGGSLLASSSASVIPASSTFLFTATTSGKEIAASSSLTFWNLTLNGSGGGWDISGVATTSNDLTILAGTATLTPAILSIGGSFDNAGGTFVANGGTLRFVATSTGKNVRFSGSSAHHVTFAGSGGTWTFLDTHATATGAFTIASGTPTLPVGVMAVGTDFDNQGGSFIAPQAGTLKMTGTGAGRIIRMNGSALGGIHVAGAGEFTMTDEHATTTGDVRLSAGTTTLASSSLAVFGSFINESVFVALGTSTVSLTATTGAEILDPGNSAFVNLVINGAGSFTIAAHATTTGDFSLRAAGSFTLASGQILSVGGTFTNEVGGSKTTWTDTTLKLFSGTEFNVNTKTAGGDGYGTLELGPNTRIRSWNSSSTVYVLDPSAFVYSQDHGGVDGDLNIYGRYRRTIGADYWSYATDFDGTALGGSSRQVDVRFAAGASAYFATGTTLEIRGATGATTTVDRQSSGNFGIEVQGGTINGLYYQFRNMDADGLKLTSTTTIASLDHGDFELAVSGGSMLTLASTTIDQNSGGVYSFIRFGTSTAISGANVRRVGTTTTAISFQDHYGNMAGEAFDEDGDTACGSIRWSDSACLFADQYRYRWRNDDGGEGAPASEWYDQNWTKRKRVHIANTASVTYNDVQVRLWVPYDSDMQADFDDLRFTDASGTTSIPYWIESVSTAASSSVWVRVPTLPAGGAATVYMYYGNGTANSASSGTSTFIFFDDFEDGSLSEYSGDTSFFEASTAFNYERTRGLDASAGNESGQNTDGIANMSASVGRDTTLRFFQYIDMTTGGSDEPCFLFAIQSPLANNQNYGVCLSPFGADEVTIARNVSYNGRNDGSTQLSTKTVTYTTGWYEVSVDWLSQNNQINVSVYDSTGALFATTSATDSTYTSGAIGFTFWGQHGGWDIPTARVAIASTSPPSIQFGVEQTDSGATWKAAENTALIDQVANQNVRLRLTIRNTGTTLADQNFRLQVASKGTSPNCESVPSASYTDVTTTTGGCGSSPACMKTSNNISDRASTTQLLTTPGNLTYAYGQILSDPSNQTGNITLQNGEFTEVEYNFQMTAFATQNAYCFRTTKAGTALDNYTKVAELRMLHIPSISNFLFNGGNNIALVEGTTTVIVATGTVTDFNGYQDIVAASSTYYRSSVSGGNYCAGDNNNCYHVATTSCVFSDCSGNSCTVTCSAHLWYFADPTDAGSFFAADNWLALLDVWDTGGSHATTTDGRELLTLRALAVPPSLNYGSIAVGGDTGASPTTTPVNNTGNTTLNLLLSGTNMTAGASVIPVDYEKYATSTFTYSSCAFCNQLSTSSTPYNIGVDKPTTTVGYFKDIFWGVGIPLGTAASTHSGMNTFLAN